MPIFSQFGEIVWQRLFNIARILKTTALKDPSGCRAYSQLQRFLVGTTVIRTMSVTGRKITKQICYFKFSTSNAKHLKQSLRAIVDHLTSPDEVEESVVFL